MTPIIILVGIAIIWALPALYTYPTNLAYFQRKWWDIRDASADRQLSLMMCVFGPIGAAITFFSNDGGVYGRTWHATDSNWATGKTDRDRVRLEEHRSEWDDTL